MTIYPLAQQEAFKLAILVVALSCQLPFIMMKPKDSDNAYYNYVY